MFPLRNRLLASNEVNLALKNKNLAFKARDAIVHYETSKCQVFEIRVGLEPTNIGFADQRVKPASPPDQACYAILAYQVNKTKHQIKIGYK